MTLKGGGLKNVNISTWSIIKVFLIFIGFAFLWVLKDVIVIVFVALLLAALIDPFALWFENRHIPRGLAVLIIYLLLFLLGSLVIILLIPPLIEQTTQLIQTLGYSESFASFLGQIKNFGVASGITTDTEFLSAVQSISQTVTGFLGGIGALLIVLVLAFYMVIEEKAGVKLFKTLAPAEYQPYLTQLLGRMRERIGGWLRGQILLGVIVGVITFIGLMIIDVRYALVLALIAGILEIIPYLGPILAAVPAVVLTFVDSPTKGLIVLIFYLVVQQIENNLLVPRVMQKVAGLNPIVSIIALIIGLQLGGIVGAILAIPVTLMVTVVLEDLFLEGRKS